MKKLLALLILIVFMVPPSLANAEVIVYLYANFTIPYSITSTWNLKEYSWTQRDDTGIHRYTLNDNIRAVETTDGETVELYEHANYKGRVVTIMGTGRWILPSWFWDRASSISINGSKPQRVKSSEPPSKPPEVRPRHD